VKYWGNKIEIIWKQYGNNSGVVGKRIVNNREILEII
jgi:hypothetical protein